MKILLVKIGFCATILFYCSLCFGQSDQMSIPDDKQFAAKETAIDFELIDERGNSIKYNTITFEESTKMIFSLSENSRSKIEKNIKDFENQNNITDRIGKIYLVNSRFEVISVRTQEK